MKTIKFNDPIKDYKYILSFDIAKKITGYSMVNTYDYSVIFFGTIDTGFAKDEFIWTYFYKQVVSIFKKASMVLENDPGSKCFIVKEKMPNQGGKFSTIETLQGLAQAHAIFDLAVDGCPIPAYDYDGVHSVSVKAYFKSITEQDKPQKKDIYEAILNKYKFEENCYSFDVTDSIAVIETLINKKYLQDIETRIKEIRKDIRGSKLKQKIERLNSEIKKLERLK